MRISIAGKVCFILLLIFSSVLLAITGLQTQRELAQLQLIARWQGEQQLEHYFRYLDLRLQDRIPLAPYQAANTTPIRLTTGDTSLPASIQQRLPLQTQHDAISTGETHHTQGNQNWLTVTRPYLLTRELQAACGAQCQALTVGQQLGMASVQVPLTAAREKVETAVLKTALLLSLLFGAGVLLALYIIRRQVVAPLQQISIAMERASDLGDHTIRLPIAARNDELTRLSENFNQLMDSLTPRR